MAEPLVFHQRVMRMQHHEEHATVTELMADKNGNDGPVTQYVFVDTSAFRHRQFALDGRVLGTLRELANEGHAHLLSTIITVAECKKQIREAVDLAVAKQKKFLGEAWVLKRFAELTRVFEKFDATKLADRLSTDFDRYLHDAKANIVDIGKASVSDVVDRYLQVSPPFGPQDKKHEFPDAIVISALAHWAAVEGEAVYVVTRDERFREACEAEDDLYPLTDVSDFLSEIARHEEVASARIGKLFAARTNEILEMISNKFKELAFYLDTDIGDGDAEVDTVEEVKVESQPEIIDLDESSATLELTCDVTFIADISYEDPNSGVWDSEDHRMLFVETRRATVRQTTSITAEVLLEFKTIEDLAHSQTIKLSITDMSPDPVRVRFSSEDAWYSCDDDYDPPE